MARGQVDWIAIGIWLGVAAIITLLVGTEYMRRRGEFRYASAPLWPRTDGSVRPVVEPPHVSFGEVWDLEPEVDRAA